MENKMDASERTVFVAQLPPDVVEGHLYNIMEQAGPIEKLIFKYGPDNLPQYSLLVYKMRESVVWCMMNMSVLTHNGRQLLVRPLRESSHMIAQCVQQPASATVHQRAQVMMPLNVPSPVQTQPLMVDMSVPPPTGPFRAADTEVNRPITRLFSRQQQEQAMQFSGAAMSTPVQPQPQMMDQSSSGFASQQLHMPPQSQAHMLSMAGPSAGRVQQPQHQHQSHGYLLMPMVLPHQFQTMGKHWAKH